MSMWTRSLSFSCLLKRYPPVSSFLCANSASNLTQTTSGSLALLLRSSGLLPLNLKPPVSLENFIKWFSRMRLFTFALSSFSSAPEFIISNSALIAFSKRILSLSFSNQPSLWQHPSTVLLIIPQTSSPAMSLALNTERGVLALRSYLGSKAFLLISTLSATTSAALCPILMLSIASMLLLLCSMASSPSFMSSPPITLLILTSLAFWLLSTLSFLEDPKLSYRASRRSA
mmetsp:Transcript_19802/g.41332  ORF Transcript_19802/g.41332 Transcript_19802/m.41332 type:complete len:230 (-) Transcript_19802:175-864(-)